MGTRRWRALEEVRVRSRGGCAAVTVSERRRPGFFFMADLRWGFSVLWEAVGRAVFARLTRGWGCWGGGSSDFGGMNGGIGS
jgi:hypothetical protein